MSIVDFTGELLKIKHFSENVKKTIIPRCLAATGNYLYDKGENDERFQ